MSCFVNICLFVFRKYIHRCFSCQNLLQSHELIRRVRAGRIYHADCFSCLKCKRVLQDDDITALIPTDGSILNDMDYLCQICSNSANKLVTKPLTGRTSSSNADEGLYFIQKKENELFIFLVNR